MKQNSPAKLRKPLMRKPGARAAPASSSRSNGTRRSTSLTARLREDPRRPIPRSSRSSPAATRCRRCPGCGRSSSARRTGRRTAASARSTWRSPGLYTIGYSFWEFGAPDWDHAKYFLLWGVAEDHSSNPIKIGLDKLKRHGAKFVSINPVRTGYSAIADEWVPIRPGTDGLLALAIVHVLLKRRHDRLRVPRSATRTRRGWSSQTPGTPDDGLFARDDDGNPLVWRRSRAGVRQRPSGADIAPALFAQRRRCPTAAAPRRCSRSPPSAISTMRYCARRRVAARVRRCRRDDHAGSRAKWRTSRSTRRSSCRSAGPTCGAARTTSVVGRPVAMYAMRGVSAHSNGFQTCRALHLLQMLLGALDGPGNFARRAPYPRRIPMRARCRRTIRR